MKKSSVFIIMGLLASTVTHAGCRYGMLKGHWAGSYTNVTRGTAGDCEYKLKLKYIAVGLSEIKESKSVCSEFTENDRITTDAPFRDLQILPDRSISTRGAPFENFEPFLIKGQMNKSRDAFSLVVSNNKEIITYQYYRK